MKNKPQENMNITRYIGPGLGIIGGLMLLLASFIFFSEYSIILYLFPLLIVPEIVTPVLAISSLLASLLIINRRKIGKYLLLITGIVACITFLVPIQTLIVDGTSVNITISGSFYLIDPFLVLIGGLISIIINSENKS